MLELYCWDPSAPTRAVYLCLKALGIEYDKKEVNLFKQQQFEDEFIKKNPQHTIPLIIDNGITLWDSHAICSYLVSKYADNDALYPKDLVKRALVDQRLHFDSGLLFPRIISIIVPLIWKKTINVIPEDEKKKVNDAYGFLEKFLEDCDYVAGDSITIADFCCISSISTLAGPLRMSVDNYPRIKAWINRCSENMVGYKDSQERGLSMFTMAVNAALTSPLMQPQQ